MTVLRAALDVAATWRATRLVTEDEITRQLREAITAWAGEASDDELRGKVRYLVNCPYCVSVWVGAAIAAGLAPRWVKDTLALSAGALAISWVAQQVEEWREIHTEVG